MMIFNVELSPPTHFPLLIRFSIVSRVKMLSMTKYPKLSEVVFSRPNTTVFFFLINLFDSYPNIPVRHYGGYKETNCRRPHWTILSLLFCAVILWLLYGTNIINMYSHGRSAKWQLDIWQFLLNNAFYIKMNIDIMASCGSCVNV